MQINSNGIKIITASFQEAKKEIISILNRNRSSQLKDDYFFWRYDSIFGAPINCLAEIKNRTVGLSTLFLRPLKVQDGVFSVADGGHFSVDEEYRGRGIFNKLLEKLLEEMGKRNINFIFVIPNEMAKKGLLRAGLKEIACLNYYKKVVNAKPKLRKIIKNSFLAEVLGAISNFFLKYISIASFIKFRPYHLNEISKFNEEFDQLWGEISTEIPIARIRDSRFLTWRFCSKPDTNYKFLELRKNDQLRGYAIINISYSTATIVDFLCIRNDFLPLINNVISHLRRFEEVNSVLIVTSYLSYYRNLLLLLGFFSSKEKLSIFCGVNPLQENKCFKEVMDIKNWFITQADKDTF